MEAVRTPPPTSRAPAGAPLTDGWGRQTGAEIRALVEQRFGPLLPVRAKPSSTAQRFRFADGVGELGFINPVSEPFCSACDRIRMTARRRLRRRTRALLRWAVAHKELKHKITDPGFVRASRSMSQIGG
jgi:cyclic pyranopterin phosphate synthase